VDALDGHNIYYVGPHSLANHQKKRKVNNSKYIPNIKVVESNYFPKTS